MEIRPEDGVLGRLTPRERDVLALLRLGLTNQEIAERLGMSSDGAKYHVSEIIGKLGVRDRYEAASWPERRPWWTAALTPIVLLWRNTVAIVPINLSSVAAATSVGLLVTVLGGIGLIAFLLVRSDENSGSETVLTNSRTPQLVGALAVSSVLQQLAPGTTFHTVDVVYRRHGPETPPSAGPETLRTEAWVEFDETGALASYRSETRNAADDTIFQTAALEGNELVMYNADGVETTRIERFRGSLTVDGLNERIADATTQAAEAVSASPDAPPGEVGGQAVLVLEVRRPFRSGVPAGVGTGGGTGFEIPHVADLNPVDEIRRDYILPDEFRSVRSEVAIVGEDGQETVVESRDHKVFEVIPSVVPAPAVRAPVLPPTTPTPTPVPPAAPTPVQAAFSSAAVGPYPVPLVSHVTITSPDAQNLACRMILVDSGQGVQFNATQLCYVTTKPELPPAPPPPPFEDPVYHSFVATLDPATGQLTATVFPCTQLTGSYAEGRDVDIQLDKAGGPASGTITITSDFTSPFDCVDGTDFTGPLTMTPLAQSHDDDIWGPNPGEAGPDGCSTWEELGTAAPLGGLRDPFNFWDFYDVPAGEPPARDQRVNIIDIGAINLRFGATGDPTGDPLSSPPAAPAYHTAFDRGSPVGPDLWNLGPPDGSINITDIGAAVAQFGHTCSAAP